MIESLLDQPSLSFLRTAAGTCTKLHASVREAVGQLVFALGEQLSLADATDTRHWKLNLHRLVRIGRLALPHTEAWLTPQDRKRCIAAVRLLKEVGLTDVTSSKHLSAMIQMLERSCECQKPWTLHFAHTMDEASEPLYEVVSLLGLHPQELLARYHTLPALFATLLTADTCPSVKDAAVRGLIRMGDDAAVPVLTLLEEISEHCCQEPAQSLAVTRMALRVLGSLKPGQQQVARTQACANRVLKTLDGKQSRPECEYCTWGSSGDVIRRTLREIAARSERQGQQRSTRWLPPSAH